MVEKQGSYQVTSAPGSGVLRPQAGKQADRSKKRHKARNESGQTRPGLEALTSMSGNAWGVMRERVMGVRRLSWEVLP